jgi:hypothetical protein
MYFLIEPSCNLKIVDIIIKNKTNFVISKTKKLPESDLQYRKRSKFDECKIAVLMYVLKLLLGN